MTDHIDTTKAQLAALGDHQPLCLATGNEALKRQVAVMSELILRCMPYVLDEADWGRSYEKGLIKRIDDALTGKLPEPAPVVPVDVTETIRTAPERIWLQVGDQSHYHSEPFPSDTSEVSWCADSVIACEVPYVRADLVGKLPYQPVQHPDDAAVDRFSVAMKAKLASARAKGRSGWDDPAACSVDHLADLLLAHIGKGNPGTFEDIGNFAMMLHQRGADPAVLAGKLPDHIADVSNMVTEGWQVVPVAPTPEMLSADGCTAHGDDEWCNSRQERRRIWKAMLAAAPKPQGGAPCDTGLPSSKSD